MPLVHRIQQLDGVEHTPGLGVRQLADQCLDCLGAEGRAAQVRRHHVLSLDAAPKRPQVLLARPDGRQHPQPDHRQAGVTQLLPVPAQAPVLDQHQDQQRAHALRQPVHRDVDKRLGAVFQFRGQWQKQYFPRRLVEGVAQRGVEDPGQARRPQGPVEQDDDARRAKADRQHQQREADAEHAMNAAGETDLDDEANQRQVDRDLGEKGRDGVGVVLARSLGDRHVQLLFDDRRADRGKGNHHRDHLQVPRRTEQLDGLAAAHALVFTGLGGVTGARRLLAPHDEGDDEEAAAHDGGADQQHLLGAERFHQKRRQRCAGGAAQAGAAADKPENALGLAGIVDVVGERPELADQQHREDRSEQVERDRDPPLAGVGQQDPEQQQQAGHPGLRHGNGPAPRHRLHQHGVALHQEADQDAGAKLHPRQVVGAEARDELRPGDRSDHVVTRHREERVQKHQQGGGRLAVAQLHDGAEDAGEQGGSSDARILS